MLHLRLVHAGQVYGSGMVAVMHAAVRATAVFGAGAHSPWSLFQSNSGDATSGPDAAHTSAVSRKAQLERWFARYQAPLLDYLYGMTRDREWAADLTQETFLRAYSATSADIDAIERPQAWLYRIATNAAISALRRKRRFDWLPLSAVEPEAGANSSDRWLRPDAAVLAGPDIATTVVERDAVWSVLAELPPRWRAALLLQATVGFQTREIATQLGISETNARKVLFRAKERYRQIAGRLAEVEAKGERR